MKGWTVTKASLRSSSLALLFALCQIVGTMCAVPDLSLAGDLAQLAGEMNDMACPMDGTIMCPPSLTASPERQIKKAMVAEVDPVISLVIHPRVFTDISTAMMWSWDTAYSLVPLSISSSSILRI
jgi:hypothetical protein